MADAEGGQAAVEGGGVERHLEATVGGPLCVWGVGKRAGWPHCPAWGPRPVGETVPRKPLVHPPLLLTSATSSANHGTQGHGIFYRTLLLL